MVMVKGTDILMKPQNVLNYFPGREKNSKQTNQSSTAVRLI